MSWLTRHATTTQVLCTGCGTSTRPDRCGAPALCPQCTLRIKTAVAAETLPYNDTRRAA